MTRNLRRSLAAAVTVLLALIIPDAASASPGIFPAPATGLLWLYTGTGPDQGTLVQWNLNGTGTVTGQTIWAMKCSWEVECEVYDQFAGVADFDGDKKHDLFTRETVQYGSGRAHLHTNAKEQGWFHWTSSCGPECQTRPIGIRDFNKDGKQDVLWYAPSPDGHPVISLFNGTDSFASIRVDVPCDWNCSQEWTPIAVGDLNSDGFHDLLWWNIKEDGPGLLHAWLLNANGQRLGTLNLSWTCADDCRLALWNPIGLGDMDGDGDQDLLWRHFHSGQVAYWELNGHGIVLRDQYLSWRCDYECGQVWRPVGIVDPEHKRGIRWP